MDRPHWPQEIVVKPMEEDIVVPNTTNSNNTNNPSKPSSSSSSFERRVRPQKAAAHVNCPRCDSTNTKFCYYNNYSLSQPRYFCKTCRRYWTEGGTLRNIPVGGGSRKNKRSSSSSTSLSHSKNLFVPPASTSVLSQNPRIPHHHHHHHHHQGHYGQDLNLGFSSTNNFKNVSEFLQVPNFDHASSSASTTTSSTSTTASAQFSALELLNGITTRGSIGTTINSFMPIPIQIPDPNSVYSASGELMIPIPEFKIPSSLSFSLDGMASGGSGYGNSLHSNTGGALLFPFEELKTNTSTTHEDPDHVGQTRDDQNGDSNGFWNGMLGGGSW